MKAGVVVAFDVRAGLGRVRDEGDGREYDFHATQISGGGRDIDEGAHVRFDVAAGHLGRWEAVRVEKL